MTKIKITPKQIIKDINDKKATVWDLAYQYTLGKIEADDYKEVLTSVELTKDVPLIYREEVFATLTLESALKSSSAAYNSIGHSKKIIDIKKEIQQLTFDTAEQFINEIVKSRKLKTTKPGLIKKYIAPLTGKMIAKTLSAFTIGASSSIGDGLKDLIMTMTDTHGSSLHEISQQMIGVPNFSEDMFMNQDGVTTLTNLSGVDLSSVQTREGVSDLEGVFKELGENMQNSSAWARQGISDALIEIVDEEMVEKNLLATMGEKPYKALKNETLQQLNNDTKSKILGMIVTVTRYWNQPSIQKAAEKVYILESVLSPYDAAISKIHELELQIREIVREEVSKDINGKPFPEIELIIPKGVDVKKIQAVILNHARAIKERINLVANQHYTTKINTRIANSGLMDKIDMIHKRVGNLPKTDIKKYEQMLLIDMVAHSKEVVFKKSNRFNEGKKFSTGLAKLLKEREVMPGMDRGKIIASLTRTEKNEFDTLKKEYNSKSALVNKLKLHPQKYVIGKVVKQEHDRSGYLWKLENNGKDNNKEIEAWAENIAISEVKKIYLAVPKGDLAGVGSTLIALDRAAELRESYIQQFAEVATDIRNIKYDKQDSLEKIIKRAEDKGLVRKSDLEKVTGISPIAEVVDDLKSEIKNFKTTLYHTQRLNQIIFDLVLDNSKQNNENDIKRKSV